MRTFLFTLLSLLIGASYVLANNVPPAVVAIPEGRFTSDGLVVYNPNWWHTFLQEHGQRIINEALANIPVAQRSYNLMMQIQRLKQLARDPEKEMMAGMTDSTAILVAAHVIERYAEERYKPVRDPAVRESVYQYLRRPRNEGLLLNNPNAEEEVRSRLYPPRIQRRLQ
ncbi:uncharacterized protein SPSC_01496 [Sporisorium scitamineum]|uniref:Uncharacterized protein n=1 Tax=Sporisorium scitamineum TaxID=49012 RepID=A0A127Z9W7_9BASI|nr:uncharacterized protein SPSC_01496 [Sporisorium scitamineum]